MFKIGGDLGAITFQHRACRFHDVGIALDLGEVTAAFRLITVPAFIELVQLNVLDQHVALIGAPSGVTFVAVAEPLRGSEQALFGLVHAFEFKQCIGDFTIVGRLILAGIFVVSVERDATGGNFQGSLVICDSQFGFANLVVGKSPAPKAETAGAPIGDSLGRDNPSDMIKCRQGRGGKCGALFGAVSTSD